MSNNSRGPGGHRGPLVGSFTRLGCKAEAQIPVGLERLLLMAANDPDLRARLKDDPRAACAGLGFELSASERALLAALTPSALDAMIDRLAPGKQRNKRFLRNVGAAAMLGGMLVATCQCQDGLECGATDPDSDVDNDSDTDTDSDVDSDTDTDTWTDTETETETETDQDAGPDAGPDGGPDSGA